MRGASSSSRAGDGRRPGATPTPGSSLLQVRTLQRSLDRLSSRVPDPLQKLWFIQTTLAAFDSIPGVLRSTPVLRGLLFHYKAIGALGELAFGEGAGEVDVPRLVLYGLYRGRLVAFGIAVLALAFGTVQVVTYAHRGAIAGVDWAVAQVAPPPDSGLPHGAGLTAEGRLVDPPKEVWLVRREGDEELWSNGLRVVTTFETESDPRSFFAFPRDGSPPMPMGPRPVGIVYHASESDMSPFGPAFNRDILATTKDLLGWLSRRRIYNYVIDRFGQVYRLVPDDSVAIHAGISIWGDDRSYYLNLNDSFIGIAFESQWSKAEGDAITPAQILAALNLTDLLRARYGIDDADCVPHGLVSVNAGKRLIGYHADWARNFPFAALGLSDKYVVPPPSVSAFGFGYDDDLVGRLGGSLWPGVAAAERALARRASLEGRPVDELRNELQRRYLQNLELARLGRSALASGKSGTRPPEGDAARGGGPEEGLPELTSPARPGSERVRERSR
jgi:N-acetylmuramoyl-L-alanine amidase